MLFTQIATKNTKVVQRIDLKDGGATTAYIARYDRNTVRPRVVTFKRATRLLDWCESESIDHAIVGGFFLRPKSKLLGEYWINGQQIQSVSFDQPWDEFRGSIYIDEAGELSIASRRQLPRTPRGDLLQAGPMLIKHGRAVKTSDPEGFSSANGQFDTDITSGRYARAAVGIDKKYIWSVAVDGRQCSWQGESQDGLTLHEFAEFLKGLGIQQALNLDGGSSTSLIYSGKLLNHPRSDHKLHPRGRAVHSAIVIEPLA